MTGSTRPPREPEMTAVLPAKMLIGREFVAGTETAEEILNPRTGEVLLRLPEASIE